MPLDVYPQLCLAVKLAGMALPANIGPPRTVPDSKVTEALERLGIASRTLTKYIREDKVIWTPVKLKGGGRGWWYAPDTIARLEAIAGPDPDHSKKGITSTHLRHYLWAKKGFDLPDWTLWRDDRVAELEEVASLLASHAEAVVMAAAAGNLDNLSATYLEHIERYWDSRDKGSAFDRRRLSPADRWSIMAQGLRWFADPTNLPPADFPTAFLNADVDISGAETARQQVSVNVLSIIALVDAMRQMTEGEATRHRDFICDQFLPAVKAHGRPVLRLAYEEPRSYGMFMAALKVQEDAEGASQ